MSDNIPPSQMLRVPTSLVDAVKELSRLHRSGYTSAVLTGLQQLIASIDSTADSISSVTAGKSDTELLAELIAGLDERIAVQVAVQIAQLEHRLSAQLENSKPQDVVGELPRLASVNQSELEQSEVAQLEVAQLELEQFRQTPPVVVESPARFEIDVDAQAANPIEDTALGDIGEVELAQSELAQSELAQSELAQSELAQSELAQSEVVQLEEAQSQPAPPVVVESPARIEVDVDAQAVKPLEDMGFSDLKSEFSEVEDADTGNMLEDIPIPAYVAKGTYAKIQPKKSGKKLPGVVAKLVAAKLLPGQQLAANDLAPIIEVTAQAIRDRRNAEKQGKAGKLAEWGLRFVPDSTNPELFERI